MRCFWLGHSKAKSSCLRSWDQLYIAKKIEGLSFRRMKEANNALFSKLARQVASDEEKIWVKAIEGHSTVPVIIFSKLIRMRERLLCGRT